MALPGLNLPIPASRFTTSSGFGWRWGAPHNGLDFAADMGEPYYAAHDGVVVRAGTASGFGHWIVLDGQDSIGYDTVYGHSYASGLLVRPGDVVRAGDRIGLVGSDGGSTGPHLHFEMWTSPGRFGGRAVDPAPLLAGAPDPGALLAPTPPADPLDGLTPEQLRTIIDGLGQWSEPHTTRRV